MPNVTVDTLLIESLSWSLVHFVWQGVVVAAVVALGYVAIGPSPNGRYVWGVVGLLVLVACPAMTFFSQFNSAPSEGAVSSTTGDGASRRLATTIQPFVIMAPTTVRFASPNEFRDLTHIGIVAAWMLGQLIVGGRLLLAGYYVRRLRQTTQPAAEGLQKIAERMAIRLHVCCPVIAVGEQVGSAIAAGLFRRMVVVPAAWAVEMSPAMLEAVVAHELAHFRRHDLWVNFLQRLVEAVFFFHPAVWWVSGRIRRDRESCCDLMAVTATQQPKQYAETLEYVAGSGSARAELLVASLGDDRMSLLRRVRLVLGQHASPSRAARLPAGVLVTLIPCTLLWICYGETSNAEPPTVQASVPAEPPAVVPVLYPSFPKQPMEANGKRFLETWKLGDYVIEPPDVVIIELECDELECVDAARQRPIRGEHLVGPDGTIQLGDVGRVRISGFTLRQATERLEKRLAEPFGRVNVSLDVVHSNSKVAYASATGTPTRGAPATGTVAVVGTQKVSSGTGGTSTKNRLQGYQNRIPVLGPLTSTGFPAVIELPSDDEILGLVRVGQPNSELVLPKNRSRVIIETKLIADFVDPPRVYPLIGKAQQHHAHYKCVVSLKGVSSTADGPQDTTTNSAQTFYIDHNHLHAGLVRPVTSPSGPSAAVVSSRKPQTEETEARVTIAYDVEDLVLPAAISTFSKTGERKRAPSAEADFSTLIELLVTTVAPDSWEELGGPGTLSGFPTNNSLVVSQGMSVHEAISDLLEQLRRLQETVVTLAARDLRLTDSVVRDLGLQGKRFAVLTGEEQQRLLKDVQRNPYTRSFPELKAQLWNGQLMMSDLGEESSLGLQPFLRNDATVLLAATLNEESGPHPTVEFDGGQSLIVRVSPETASPDDIAFRLISVAK